MNIVRNITTKIIYFTVAGSFAIPVTRGRDLPRSQEKEHPVQKLLSIVQSGASQVEGNEGKRVETGS